jgi:homoserine O-succinyltransferase/O-acetyltransferase
MPLIVNKKLPAYEKLRRELVSEISTERARKQDIRPLEIGILNLMPAATVERTETQFLRLLANTPLQIKPTLIYFDKHKSSKQDHFDAFYRSISQVKESGLDGLIITGGNLESHKFEDIFFWNELTDFFDWAHTHVTSTVYACWAAQAKLYHKYEIKPHIYKKKIFGVFEHDVKNLLNSPLTAGMDDHIFVPHARQRGIESRDVKNKRDLEVLIESKEVGPHLIVGRKGRELYIQGHQEYDRNDIAGEYYRDVETGLKISFPKNYFPDDDENKVPIKNWGANGQVLYANWVNWVYQTTDFEVKKPLMN